MWIAGTFTVNFRNSSAGVHKLLKQQSWGAECADFTFHNSVWFSSLYLTNLPHLSSCLFCIASAAALLLKIKRHTHKHKHTLQKLKPAQLVGQKARVGINMEACYKQVGFIFIGIHMVWLYSWQLQEIYMQSAPATERLKHAQWIKSKTEEEKKSSHSSRWHWEAKMNHKPFWSAFLTVLCLTLLSVSFFCTEK